jgi:hypothetical protein
MFNNDLFIHALNRCKCTAESRISKDDYIFLLLLEGAIANTGKASTCKEQMKGYERCKRGSHYRCVFDVKLVCINNYFSASSTIQLKYCITYIFAVYNMEKDKRQGVPRGGGHTRLRERGRGDPIKTKGQTFWYSTEVLVLSLYGV